MLEYALVKVLNEVATPLIGADKIYPVFGTEVPCITYTNTPISGTVIKQDQVELKIIHSDYDEALAIRKAILKKMNMDQKEPSLLVDDIVIRSQLAGGGSLYNDGPQVWELSVILIIMWRCR